jgi:signal transduction histidine kinase/ligand-binding sensor domain-containing protein
VSRLLAKAAACLPMCLLLLAPCAPGAAPSAPLESIDSEYLVETWQTERGLPDNFVNAIAQTPDGYLWVATFNGLARFNGVEFVVFDVANTPELFTSRITDLHCDRKGRLWIISEYGDLTQWSQGRFKAFGEHEGLPKQGGGVVWEDHEGGIWSSSGYHAANYFQYVDGAFRPARATNTLYLRFGRAADRRGYGWSIHSNHLFSTHGQYDVTIPQFTPPEAWRLTAASDGDMWLIASRIQKFHPAERAGLSASDVNAEGHFEDFGPIPVATDQFMQYLGDSRGNLWVGTGAGELWRIGTNHAIRRFKFPNSTTLELGRAIFEDAEGNLWIGNGGDGLARVKPRALKTFDSRDGLASDVVRSVAQDGEGNVWLATVNRVDWFAHGNSGRAEPRGIEMKLPWNTYGARDGAMWIGTMGDGLLRISRGSQTWFKEPSREVGIPELNVIFEDRRGQIQVGMPDGLYQIESGCLIHRSGPEGLAAMDIRSMAESPAGDLYLGLNGEGLLRKNNKGWERFTTRDGLAENHVWALYADADGALWIGTHGAGLSRLKDGRFFNFSKGVGRVLELELPAVINSIIEDDSGHLWLGSNQGLFRVERRQLNDLAEGRTGSASVTHYDRANGMGSSQCTGDRQPTAWKAHDGTLWFATMKGVTVVDPKLLPFNSRPPPVVVEAALVDDALSSLVASASSTDKGTLSRSSVTIPAGVHRLEIRYAGLSFTAPDRVLFRYRLAGFDKDWINAGTRRAAYYTKVPPGSYTFEVLACNNDNVWNETGASLAVVVKPLLWQTAWFRFVAILCAAGFAIALYELRVLRLKRQQAMQENFSRSLIESQENERKRIAAELHDGLGQNLLVVKNYAAMALKESQISDKTQKQLQEISESASASIEEVRSIARALRPYQLDRFGLTKTLEDSAEVAAHAGRLEIATTVDNIDGLFSSDAEISIYRIVQEWLNNVVKHSRATHGRLLVRKEPGMLRMILEDDGVGFDYDSVMKRAVAGFGLANLNERTRLLRGSLRIETVPGKGTRLSVDLPFKK